MVLRRIVERHFVNGAVLWRRKHSRDGASHARLRDCFGYETLPDNDGIAFLQFLRTGDAFAGHQRAFWHIRVMCCVPLPGIAHVQVCDRTTDWTLGVGHAAKRLRRLSGLSLFPSLRLGRRSRG